MEGVILGVRVRVAVLVIIERIVSVARAGGQRGWRCLAVATARKSGVGISRTGCRAAKTTGATAVRMASVEDLGTLWSCERTGKWRERRALLRMEPLMQLPPEPTLRGIVSRSSPSQRRWSQSLRPPLMYPYPESGFPWSQ